MMSDVDVDLLLKCDAVSNPPPTISSTHISQRPVAGGMVWWLECTLYGTTWGITLNTEAWEGVMVVALL